MLKVVLVCILTILLFTTLPHVRAQSTTITNLQSPLTALVGRDVVVVVSMNYDLGSNGKYLGIAIWDKDANSFATGTATSSPDACENNTGQYANSAACIPKQLSSRSGSEVVSFNLQLHTVKTYSMEAFALIEDSGTNVISESASRSEFSITVRDKVDLTVRAQYEVTVTVDGVPQSPGNVFASVYPGSHTISVPPMVQVDNSTRLRFDEWDDGSTSTTRTLNLQDDTALSANYVTQYSLTLVSQEATAIGAGWYDSGSSVRLSAQTTVPVNGTLGLLGAKWIFQGWYEGSRLVSRNATYSFVLDKPRTLTAHWIRDLTVPIIIGGVVSAVAVIVALGLAYYRNALSIPGIGSRRTKRTRRAVRRTRTISEQTPSISTPSALEKPTSSEKSNMFCSQCGAVIPRNSQFCKECGSRIAQ